MNLTMLTSKGPSRCVLACGVEVIRKVGELDHERPDTMRHTVIVAGQHGSESGPVLALLARGCDFDLHRLEFGVLTIIRCANPFGFATGQRDDVRGLDMNRGWKAESLLDLEGNQSQRSGSAQAAIWFAITAGLPKLELVVLDLHSAGMGGLLARSVVTVDAVGWCLAHGLSDRLFDAEALAGLSHPDDRPWQVRNQTTNTASTSEVVHPVGTLASWANSRGGVGFTVEFPEYTRLAMPAGYDGPMGRNPATGQRTATFGESMHGVTTLLRWAIDRHRSG
jgi:hypothetical protein